MVHLANEPISIRLFLWVFFLFEKSYVTRDGWCGAGSHTVGVILPTWLFASDVNILF